MDKKIEIEFIVDRPNKMRPVQVSTALALEDGPLAFEKEIVELFDRVQEGK